VSGARSAMEVEPTLRAPFSYCEQGRAREAPSRGLWSGGRGKPVVRAWSVVFIWVGWCRDGQARVDRFRVGMAWGEDAKHPGCAAGARG